MKKEKAFFAAALLLAVLVAASFANATVYAAPASGEVDLRVGDAVIADSHKIVLKDVSGMPYGASDSYAATFDVYDTNGNKINSVTLNAESAGGASAYNAPTFAVSVKEIEGGEAKISVAAVATAASASSAIGGGAAQTASETSVGTAATAQPVVFHVTNPSKQNSAESSDSSYAEAKPGASGGGSGASTAIAGDANADNAVQKRPLETAVTSDIMIAPQKTFALSRGWNLVSTAFAGATITTTCKYKTECPACVAQTACEAACRVVGPKLWNYDSAAKRYDSPGALGAATLARGKGYWVYAANDCSFTVEYASDETPYWLEGLELRAGWNQIGGPTHEIDLSELAGGSNCDVRAAWGFDARSNRYVKASKLEPGKAYFVRVARDCSFNAKRTSCQKSAANGYADWIEDC